jgi:nitrogen fixation-related uncharacterized protein
MSQIKDSKRTQEPTTVGENVNELVQVDLPPEQLYTPKRKNTILVVFQWSVIIIAGTGFTFKFIEFTYSIFKTGNEIVQFAITPIVMYVLVAIGFFSLFIWTVLRGDYKDIERPKFRLFEREYLLDEEDQKERDQDALKEIIKMPISKN